MRLVFAATAGLIFGLGLNISGMTNAHKVQGWLDIFGAWDPTLAFVLGGAIIPMLIAWFIANHRERAVLGDVIPAQADPIIDRRLIGGSALFGIGWAISGLCPGPAIAVLGVGGTGAWTFLIGLIAGMAVWNWLIKPKMVPA